MHNSFLFFIQDKAEEAQQEEARKMKLTYWTIKKYFSWQVLHRFLGRKLILKAELEAKRTLFKIVFVKHGLWKVNEILGKGDYSFHQKSLCQNPQRWSKNKWKSLCRK